jgi:hypothetical protein
MGTTPEDVSSPFSSPIPGEMADRESQSFQETISVVAPSLMAFLVILLVEKSA